MRKYVICFKDLKSDSIFIETSQDFKEISIAHGRDTFKILDKKYCQSKKQARKFEEQCKLKYS